MTDNAAVDNENGLRSFRQITFDGDVTAPVARSGHRTFVDNDCFYVVGGFTNLPQDNILREMWSFNLASQKWTRLEVPHNFPTGLASFTCDSNGEGSFLIYGGTALPFGAQLDESIYIGEIENNQVKMIQSHPSGGKRGCYGHVMVYDSIRCRRYAVGGTDGQNFRLDVHSLHKVNGDDDTWVWEELLSPIEDGLYRMEAIIEKDHILLFGGGTPQRVTGFDTLMGYNIEKKRYEYLHTRDDPVYGYPIGRRCHSLVQWGRLVIIAGGSSQDISNDNTGSNVNIYGDVWSFNLDTLKWKKIGDLPTPVYFHDASVTKEGQMIIFGGVTNINASRTNIIQCVWLDPPSLFTSALAKVITQINLVSSNPLLSNRGKLTRDACKRYILPA